MNLKQNYVKTFLLSLLIEIVLAALLTLSIIFTIGYMRLNVGTFEQLSLVGYASGSEKIWVFIYYFSDILFYIIISLLFFELILMLLRGMVLRGIKTIEIARNLDLSSLTEKVKKVSLTSIFKAMKINTPKRSIIAYVLLMIIVFGSGWVAKVILNANDSFVYRSDKIINLYSDEVLVDLSGETNDSNQYKLIIDGDIVNLHLYTVSNTSEAKFYFLYDTIEQKSAYTLDINKETNEITINLNQNQESYLKYVDPVLPSIEIYLPNTLKIELIDVSIQTYGSMTMEYVTFKDLIIDSYNAELSIKGEVMMVNTVSITQQLGTLALTFDHVEKVDLSIEDVEATLRISQITDTFTIDSKSSDIFLYQTTTQTMSLIGNNSDFELREVLGIEANINLTNSKLLYVNSNSQNPAIVTISSIDSEITTKGVKND